MKKLLIMMTVVVCLHVLCGCTDSRASNNVDDDRNNDDITNTYMNVDDVLEYTEQDISFAEPYGYNLFNYRGGYSTSFDNVTYLFANSLTEEERNDVVNETVLILRDIQERTGCQLSDYTINMCTEEYEPRIDDSCLYVGFSCYRTSAYITGLCELVFGNKTNYGLLYGLANTIAKDRGYGDEVVPIEQALTICSESQHYLDLNYACFLDNYTDNDTLKRLNQWQLHCMHTWKNTVRPHYYLLTLQRNTNNTLEIFWKNMGNKDMIALSWMV